MFSNRPFTLERFRYWQGQKLLGRDFRDQVAREAQLRWWHNRALHNSFGVSFGFQVSRVIEAGAFVAVRVTCGVAYDCFGRELVLQDTRAISLPSHQPETNRKLTLVASYKESRRCGNECLPICACRIDEPELQWVLSRSLELADGVPLLEVSYEPSAALAEFPQNFNLPPGLEKKISYDTERKLLIAVGGLLPAEHAELVKLTPPQPFRDAIDRILAATERVPVLNPNFTAHQARALSRPRIGRGATIPGNTSWEQWSEILVGIRGAKFEVPLGVQVTIDTSKAGFTQLPCYFAWLQGSLWNKTNIEFFPVPFSHIDNETPQQFRFRVWLPPLVTVLGSRVRIANARPIARSVRQRSRLSEPTGFSLNEFVNFARGQRLYVCWIGIQEQEGQGLTCEPLKKCECVTTQPELTEQQSARN